VYVCLRLSSRCVDVYMCMYVCLVQIESRCVYVYVCCISLLGLYMCMCMCMCVCVSLLGKGRFMKLMK